MTAEIMLVTGGAKSGKSVFAEQQLANDQRICYIATGVMTAPDKEMQLRIKHHQARRPATWTTEERYENLAQFVVDHRFDGYLLDDATMVVTNLFYEMMRTLAVNDAGSIDEAVEKLDKNAIDQVQNEIFSEWQALLTAVKETDQRMVIVTNETGLGIVPANKQTRILRDIYGQVNQLIAKAANKVYLVVSGIPVKIK